MNNTFIDTPENELEIINAGAPSTKTSAGYDVGYVASALFHIWAGDTTGYAALAVLFI